jgi:predicted acyl esterase
VPDTDFQADVYELLSDGTSILLASDTKRARYRESLRTAKPVPPGEVLKYEFTTFNWFSRLLGAGSRLRLVVSSPNSIFVQKNYNGGGDVSRESARDARTAHVTLYHDASHPSSLELPLGQ